MIKKFRSQFLAVMLVIISVIAAGVVLNLLGAAIPVRWVHENIRASALTMQAEGPFYPVLGYKYLNSYADNNTDAVMLLMADYDGGESVFRRSVEGVVMVPEKLIDTGSSYYDFFVSYMNGSPQISAWNYSRYWSGWMFPLKLLLIFFQYEDIRFLGQAVQFLLLGILLMKLYRQNRYLPFVFLSTVLCINPPVLAISFEYSFCYYIILIHSLVLVSFYEKWKEPAAFCAFFTATGAAACYFDFLTYPIATLGICMLLYLALAQAASKWTEPAWQVVKGSVCWGAGYSLTWAFKWLLCRVVLGKEYLELAMDQIKLRTSATAGLGKIDPDAPINFWYALKNNLEVFKTRGVAALCILTVAVLLVLILRKGGFRLSVLRCKLPAYFLCFCMPFVWIFALQNHSYLHRNYTSDMFAVCVLAVEICVISLAGGTKEADGRGA